VRRLLPRLTPWMLRHVGVGFAARSRFLPGQRLLLLRALDITTVLDVGANNGQYARELRRLGYRGDIHSFEPGSEALDSLRLASSGDPSWYVHGVALSDYSGKASLTTWHGQASTLASLRSPSPGLLSYAGLPASETVVTTTLRDWLATRAIDLDKSLLKVDVQGSEREVLRGAGPDLARFAAVEVEAAIRSWYSNEALLPELLGILGESGLVCASVVTEQFFTDWLGAVDVNVLAVKQDLSRVPVESPVGEYVKVTKQ